MKHQSVRHTKKTTYPFFIKPHYDYMKLYHLVEYEKRSKRDKYELQKSRNISFSLEVIFMKRPMARKRQLDRLKQKKKRSDS